MKSLSSLKFFTSITHPIIVYYLHSKPYPKIANNPSLCLFSSLYSYSLHLFTTRYLGSLALCSAKRQPLVLPPLRTQLVQRLLALPVGSSTVLAACVTRFDCLDKRGIVAFQPVAF